MSLLISIIWFIVQRLLGYLRSTQTLNLRCEGKLIGEEAENVKNKKIIYVERGNTNITREILTTPYTITSLSVTS